MTRAQGLYHRPTDSLIKRSGAKFYPLDIPVPHAQLRNFISTVDRDWLYYASGPNIYTLHIPTKRTSLLITIPFAPRCLTAGLGWICLGGESNGDCAFVRLNAPEREDGLHVDARLPISLPETSKETGQDGATNERAVPHVVAPDAEFKFQPDLLVQELGGDIVNSITVHDLSNTGLSERNEPVALLSNNDKTVKMYSLAQRKVIAELLHPFYMNYALVSPDSNVLAAVGDGSRAFFYRRKLSKRPGGAQSSTTSPSDHFPQYEWQLFAIPKLPVGDRMNDDHSFAITFSPSGHLCAISSQGGMISVFDMEVLNSLSDEEESERAFVCTFKSSRSTIWGCVRSMEFSPEPWDLLAWSEDHGRIGVADVRQAFCRRQILQLDPEQADQIDLDDITPTAIKNLDNKGRQIHQYQYRARMQSEHMRSPSQADYSFLRNSPQAGSRAYNVGTDPDARDRSVLDTLEMTMDEIYEASHPRHQPYSLNYTSSPRVRASVESERTSSSGPADEQDGEQRERLRTLERSYLPRRRNSVVLSRQASASLAPRSRSRTRITASPSRLSQAGDTATDDDLPPPPPPPPLSTNDLTPTASGSQTQPLPYNIPPSDPWHVIENALESARASDGSQTPAGLTSLARLESILATERRLSLSAISRNMSPPSAATSAQTSGQTSALPTTIRPIDPDVRRYMDEALQQARDTLHIERRAAVRSAVGEGARDIERHQRILEARAQTRQRVATANAIANGGRSSRTEQRAELGRPSASDLRLARLMMISGNRQATDQNGNWVAGEALERLVAPRGGGADADGLGGGAAREFIRDIGIGTAGLAWSPNGRYL
jgi:hypothetical protein